MGAMKHTYLELTEILEISFFWFISSDSCHKKMFFVLFCFLFFVLFLFLFCFCFVCFCFCFCFCFFALVIED